MLEEVDFAASGFWDTLIGFVCAAACCCGVGVGVVFRGGVMAGEGWADAGVLRGRWSHEVSTP